MPLSGPWLAACVRAKQTTLLRERPEGGLEQVPLQRAFGCVVAGPQGSVLGFGTSTAVRLAPSGEPERVWRLPVVVRECLSLEDDVYLLLVGGHWERGELRQARAALWRPETDSFSYSDRVLSAWNPFELAGGGGANAQQQVLVAVRKTAPFDTVFRRRPFLFGFGRGNDDLVPLWKGTSVAHPHCSGTLAQLGLGRGAQLCALEQLVDGQRVVGAYGFSGRMQMVGASAPARLGDRLTVLHGGPGEADTLVCSLFEGTGWRAVEYGASSQVGAGGLYPLEVRSQTAFAVAAPIAWAAVRGQQGPGAVTLSKTGDLAFRALQAVSRAKPLE